MTTSTPANTPPTPIHQYEYPSVHRVGLATAETALGLPDALDEAVSAPEPYTEAYPRLQWQRRPDAAAVRYGKLFIHDKVSPAEFVSSLLKDRAPEQQASWFHDFNNLPPNAHFEPYRHHNGNWNNRLIKSSGQRAMASLLEHEGMAGQVDLIYMDPPYNINFRSNFQGLVDQTNSGDTWQDIPLDIRQIKTFRDSYQRGVHSYLDQLRTQLLHGRDLLKESGSFVMQIGPDNLHYVAVLMGEIFGHDNHVATIPYTTRANSSTRMLPEVGNWLVWYAKEKPQAKYRQLYENTDLRESLRQMGFGGLYELPDGTVHPITNNEKDDPTLIPPDARVFRRMPLDSSHESTTGRSEAWIYNPDEYPDRPAHYPDDSNAYPCPKGRQWSVSPQGLHSIAASGRMDFNGQTPNFRRYLDESPGRPISAMWINISAPQDKRYIVETPVTVLQRILLMTTDPGDLVLDPTCGSGAMPLMAERWGRRWIAVDTSAVSIAVARQRIATAVHPYWLLQDTPAGARREHELAQALLPADQRLPFAPPDAPDYGSDPARGFVLARQQRVSAATLAYGPQPSDIIRHPDRPEADGGKRRVSAAFTVESDLPFTAVSPEAPYAERAADGADTWAGSGNGNGASGGGYSTDAIVQSLTTAGIRVPAAAGAPAHTYPVHDLAATIEIPGATHTGAITDAAGAARSAVFYICGEDEVAGPFQTRHLSRAARSRGDDYAVIISYGREGDTDTVRQAQGSLTVLQVIANRDHMIPGLAVKADDNALVVISEPDLTIHQEDDGQISIAADALTVYNPATGQVETQDSRNIVAIMTDTDYDTESFCARLWNLPQKGTTSERRLRQIREAFRSDIDEAKWQRMRSSRTLPFPVPAARTVAVKVIDHTGMEHMKVLTV